MSDYKGADTHRINIARMPNSDVLWETWRLADARAREAEVRLRQAWAVFDRYGTVPSDELMREVTQLRESADRALSDLVDAVTQRHPDAPHPPSSQAARDTDPEAA